IHGKIRALERAVVACEGLGATSFACLGDVIGRGDPVACVEWVRDHASIAIVGNRDLDYLDRLPLHLQEVVRSWPHEARADGFLASHGDPRLHRILSSAAERDHFHRAATYLDEHEARLWLFGHTHRARIWEISNGMLQQIACDAEGDDQWVEIREGARYVVNVGTTGLPPPRRGGAACAIYDSCGRRFRFVGLSMPPIRRG